MTLANVKHFPCLTCHVHKWCRALNAGYFTYLCSKHALKPHSSRKATQRYYVVLIFFSFLFFWHLRFLKMQWYLIINKKVLYTCILLTPWFRIFYEIRYESDGGLGLKFCRSHSPWILVEILIVVEIFSNKL